MSCPNLEGLSMVLKTLLPRRPNYVTLRIVCSPSVHLVGAEYTPIFEDTLLLLNFKGD